MTSCIKFLATLTSTQVLLLHLGSSTRLLYISLLLVSNPYIELSTNIDMNHGIRYIFVFCILSQTMKSQTPDIKVLACLATVYEIVVTMPKYHNIHHAVLLQQLHPKGKGTAVYCSSCRSCLNKKAVVVQSSRN